MAGQSALVRIGGWRDGDEILNSSDVSGSPILPEVSASIAAQVEFSPLNYVLVNPTAALEHKF